jgi:hypothetical protein
VVHGIEQVDDSLTTYREAEQPTEPSIRVALVDEETDGEPKGMAYMLEIPLVRDVLRVWKAGGEAKSQTRRKLAQLSAFMRLTTHFSRSHRA